MGHYAPRTDPIALTVVQVAVVAVLSWLGALALEPRALPSGGQVWFAAAFTGLLATALSYSIQNVAQRHASATHTAVIFTLEPGFAAMFAWWLAGEPLGGRSLAGGALIVLGMLATELNAVVRQRPPFLPEQPVV